MKLSELLEHLKSLNELNFIDEKDELIPRHFHITEVGIKSKRFLDCGGTSRTEDKVYFQFWLADDYDHRLSPQKLVGIIEKYDFRLNDYELDVEIELQLPSTIGLFGLSSDKDYFKLTSLQTDCLAKGICDVPKATENNQGIINFKLKETKCNPNSGCC
ncbi:MAG: DUF6428 family protein [Cytophagales bacterium]